MQLIVVGSSLSVDLRLLVALENTSHDPFTVDKTTVLDVKGGSLTFSVLIAFLANWTHKLGHFLCNI